ncbi:hypothetical protein BSM4216_2578 [Bacillus smithii]|nr:hypothetical protein BSM4216_2578 [Bacillus smithii]
MFVHKKLPFVSLLSFETKGALIQEKANPFERIRLCHYFAAL